MITEDINDQLYVPKSECGLKHSNKQAFNLELSEDSMSSSYIGQVLSFIILS